MCDRGASRARRLHITHACSRRVSRSLQETSVKALKDRRRGLDLPSSEEGPYGLHLGQRLMSLPRSEGVPPAEEDKDRKSPHSLSSVELCLVEVGHDAGGYLRIGSDEAAQVMRQGLLRTAVASHEGNWYS